MTTNKPKIKIYEPSEKGATVMRKASFRNTGPDRYVRLSDYEALQAEYEKLRKDAERYRWLLNNSSVILDRHAWFKAESGTLIESTMPTSRELDAAIDAAMQRDNPC